MWIAACTASSDSGRTALRAQSVSFIVSCSALSRFSGEPRGSPTGSPWRDLPAFFSKWNTVFKRFRDWVKADIFQRLFDAVSDEPDLEYAMVDATIVKVHRHGQGAKGGLRARPLADPKAA